MCGKVYSNRYGMGNVTAVVGRWQKNNHVRGILGSPCVCVPIERQSSESKESF